MGDCFRRSSSISAWNRQPWLKGCSCKSKKKGWPVRIPKRHSIFHRNRISRFRKRGRFFGPALRWKAASWRWRTSTSTSSRFRRGFETSGKVFEEEEKFWSLRWGDSSSLFSHFLRLKQRSKASTFFLPQLLDDKILTRRKSRERRRRNNQSLKTVHHYDQVLREIIVAIATLWEGCWSTILLWGKAAIVNLRHIASYLKLDNLDVAVQHHKRQVFL